MKTKALCIGCLLAALVCTRPAHAAVIMTLEQVGSNVVATGSGTVNLAGLSFGYTYPNSPGIDPASAILSEGSYGMSDYFTYTTGPLMFGGPGGSVIPTGTGDPLEIAGDVGQIGVPHGYVSGTSLSSTATWDNTTLAALGVVTGTYTWHWGTGANADSLTLYAGVPAPTSVPEPAPALLLTLGAAALVLLKRIKK